MREPDYEQLTLFQGDSHVSPSPRPGSEEARMMTVTSGRKCSELYGNSGPLGCLVRMCLESSIWHSTRCFLTWKVKDTPARHSLFRLQVSMPRTEETESQFWPTPVNSGGINGGTGAIKTLKALERKGLITESERRQFQQGNGGHTNPALLEWLMGYEQQFTKLIPTPTQTDYKGGITSRYWMPNSQTVQVERERERAGWLRRGNYQGLLREYLECTPLGKIGQMNPNWIEWLMGYPIGWSELDASETP